MNNSYPWVFLLEEPHGDTMRQMPISEDLTAMTKAYCFQKFQPLTFLREYIGKSAHWKNKTSRQEWQFFTSTTLHTRFMTTHQSALCRVIPSMRPIFSLLPNNRKCKAYFASTSKTITMNLLPDWNGYSPFRQQFST